MDSHYDDILDLTGQEITKIKLKYAATEEEHRANTAHAVALGYPCVERGSLTSEPLAVVCFGPSLRTTYREIKHFDKVLSCSGAHRFLIDHGIVPTWHIEGDPRAHKAFFVKRPHKRVKYLIAASCHPALFNALKGYDVRLWHTLYSPKELLTMGHYPVGHMVLTGGMNVGMRAMVMGRVLGFTDIHIFGMDCSAGETAFHADEHPNEVPEKIYDEVKVGDHVFKTTELFLDYARQFFHEAIQLPDVRFTIHGDGLLHALMLDMERTPAKLQAFMDKRAEVKEVTYAVIVRREDQ